MQLSRLRWWQIPALMRIETDLFGAERWSTAMFWSELAEYGSRHYMVATEEPDADAADVADDVVGYAGLSTYGPESYIQTLGVRRDRQGAGIGRALLVAMLDEADRRESTTVGLEVRADNAVAQRLYAEHGFEPIGLRTGYYQHSGVDALVMVRHAP